MSITKLIYEKSILLKSVIKPINNNKILQYLQYRNSLLKEKNPELTS